jgi:hypothetical protein
VTAQKYDAWLVDLDGTLYWALGVRLAMAAELALFGLHKAARLRHFRESGLGDPEEKSAPAGAPVSPPDSSDALAAARELAAEARALRTAVT